MDFHRIEKDGFDGIVFYASDDREVTGMSISGLAKTAGVDRNAIKQQLHGGATSEQKKALKGSQEDTLGGDVYVSGQYNDSDITIIISDKCAEILEYYAYQSKRVSEKVRKQSRYVFLKFATKGMHNWILETVDMNERNDTVGLSRDVLSLLNHMNDQLETLNKETIELRTIRSKTRTNMVGLDMVLDDLADKTKNPLLMPTEDGYISLEGWLLQEGYQLSDTKFRSLARMVSANYKTFYLKDPEKRHFRMPDGTTKYNVYVYPESAYTILKVGMVKLLGI